MDRFAPEISALLMSILRKMQDNGLVELVYTDGVHTWIPTDKMRIQISISELGAEQD